MNVLMMHCRCGLHRNCYPMSCQRNYLYISASYFGIVLPRCSEPLIKWNVWEGKIIIWGAERQTRLGTINVTVRFSLLIYSCYSNVFTCLRKVDMGHCSVISVRAHAVFCWWNCRSVVNHKVSGFPSINGQKAKLGLSCQSPCAL